MRKVTTIIGIIAAAGGLGLACSAHVASATPARVAPIAVRPADRFEASLPAVAPLRTLVADRLAGERPEAVVARPGFDAVLGAVLAVDLPEAPPRAVLAPAPVAVRPAVRPAPAPAAASSGPRYLCAGADGVFRSVASPSACPGSSALQVVAG